METAHFLWVTLKINVGLQAAYLFNTLPVSPAKPDPYRGYFWHLLCTVLIYWYVTDHWTKDRTVASFRIEISMLWTHPWNACGVNSSGSVQSKAQSGVSYIHTTADGENTDGCSKQRRAGGGTFVFTVPPVEMASKGGTLANTTPFDSGEASQTAPLLHKGQAQPWTVVPRGFLDLLWVQCFAEKESAHWRQEQVV